MASQSPEACARAASASASAGGFGSDVSLTGRVSALRKAGRYAEAATLREGAGDLRGASQLYADVWEWEKAIALAEDAGALAMAYGHALAADDREALGRLLAMLPDHPEEAQLAAELADLQSRRDEMLRDMSSDYDSSSESSDDDDELVEAVVEQPEEAVVVTPERRERYLPPRNGGESGGRLGLIGDEGRFDVARHVERGATDFDVSSIGPCRLNISVYLAQMSWANDSAYLRNRS